MAGPVITWPTQKPPVPKKPNPVEGGGTIQGGIQNNPWTMQAGQFVPYTNPFGGGGLAGALQGAYNNTTSEFNSAINQGMGPTDPRFGAFGGFLQNLAMNPQGFGTALGQRQLTRLAERNAGVTANQQRALRDSAGAGGFRNSSSFADVLQNISGEGAKRLNDAELDFLLQNEALAQQQRATGVSGGLGLTNISAALAQMAAQFAADRERPLIDEGQGKTGKGGQFDLLNDRGEIIPFRADGTPLTAFEMERARQQRVAWMQQQGA